MKKQIQLDELTFHLSEARATLRSSSSVTQSTSGYPSSSTSAGGGYADHPDKKSYPNPAAIAGGIVGGLVGLALILLLLLRWYFKKRSNEIHKDFVFDSRALVSGNSATVDPPRSYGLSRFVSLIVIFSVTTCIITGDSLCVGPRSSTYF